METIKASIIIPVFNQSAYTKECLAAIKKNTNDFPEHEIIAVDNCSTDDTREILRALSEQLKNLRVIELDHNQGFSSACNLGAQDARADYLVFLNNDTIPQPNWLSELIQVASRKEAGVVGAKLLYPNDHTLNHAGYVYNARLGFYPIYHRVPADFPGISREREFQALLGACIAIRRRLFFEAGMFAEYGLEDIDLCFKVRELGYKVIFNPRSVVYHYGSVTLLNSPPGTFPITSAREFNRRWQAKIIPDDQRYYSQDGFSLIETEENQDEVPAGLAASIELLTKGLALRKNQPEEALRLIRESIAICRENITAHLELICLLLEQQQPEDAAAACRQFLKTAPQHIQGRMLLAKILRCIGNTGEAKTQLIDLLSLPQLPAEIKAEAEGLLAQYS